MLSPTLLPSICEIYRPFGDSTPIATNIPCRIVPSIERSPNKGETYWTHMLDLQPGIDIRDGCTRTSGQTNIVYADGDEVRVPGGSGSSRYVVVWVETMCRDTPLQYQRVYLLRHEAVFPDP